MIDKDVNVYPTIANQSEQKRIYYELKPDFEDEETGPIPRWLNEKEAFQDFPDPDLSKPFHNLQFPSQPKWFFDHTGRDKPLELEDAYPTRAHPTWLISNRLKNLFEQIDPEAFVFMKVETDYSNFPKSGPDYWFMYMMRELDCVDEEHSTIRFQINILPRKNYLALLNVKMRPEAVGWAHAFRLKYARQTLIVDDVIVDAFKERKITGFECDPIQK